MLYSATIKKILIRLFVYANLLDWFSQLPIWTHLEHHQNRPWQRKVCSWIEASISKIGQLFGIHHLQDFKSVKNKQFSIKVYSWIKFHKEEFTGKFDNHDEHQVQLTWPRWNSFLVEFVRNAWTFRNSSEWLVFSSSIQLIARFFPPRFP